MRELVGAASTDAATQARLAAGSRPGRPAGVVSRLGVHGAVAGGDRPRAGQLGLRALRTDVGHRRAAPTTARCVATVGL